MLTLLLTLAREHGKSFILSTHLLTDVERVCDTVVILHGGRVLRQGRTDELRTARRDRYQLTIEGNLPAFAEDLRLEGVQVLHQNGQSLRVTCPEGWTTRMFFTLADNSGTVLRGLERDDEDLEELFHRTIQEREPHGA
jgi:ABC-2 type transport system ATP-binding protein